MCMRYRDPCPLTRLETLLCLLLPMRIPEADLGISFKSRFSQPWLQDGLLSKKEMGLRFQTHLSGPFLRAKVLRTIYGIFSVTVLIILITIKDRHSINQVHLKHSCSQFLLIGLWGFVVLFCFSGLTVLTKLAVFCVFRIPVALMLCSSH